MHFCFETNGRLQVIAVFWPKYPAFMPGIILSIVIGMPSLISGLWGGAIALYGLVDSSAVRNDEPLWIVALLFGLIFLLPLLMALPKTEIYRYVFDRPRDRFCGFGRWLSQPLKDYEQFSETLSSIAQLGVKRFRYRKPSVSAGGYTSTPQTLTWAEIICRDRQGTTRASLKLTHADDKVIQRVSRYVGLEVRTEA